MNKNDYPSLYRCSDAASNYCQMSYIWLVKAHLVLLILTGLIACWNPDSLFRERCVSVCIALTMFAALVIGLVLKMARLDDAWFRARAFAENTKNATWRFMMAPKPESLAQEESQEKEFVEELDNIRGRFPQVEKYLSKYQDNGLEITQKMRDIRQQNTMGRLEFFKTYRLQDQIDWYIKRARMNAWAEQVWFYLIIGADGTAVVFAILRLLFTTSYNATGGIAALAACMLAWTQTKRFSDLANTYGVASRDLNGLATRANHVHTEDQLQSFIEEVETAVSREHRLWTERAFRSL